MNNLNGTFAAELDALHPRVPAREIADDVPRTVPAAILDHDYFEVLRYGRERCDEPAIELLEAALGLIDRRDN